MSIVSPSLLDDLIEAVRPLGSVAVAFSGGVDSSVVVAAAARALGTSNVLAVTADSETLPRVELKLAGELVRSLGVPHEIIRTRELDQGGFSSNGPDRCYFCKRELWQGVRGLAQKRGIESLADGVNADDLSDHRPGIRASDEAGVIHPLARVGAGKAEVRSIAEALGLPNWNKPSQACLSSRIPYGERITAEVLERVERAEEFLRHQGFSEFRVRSHGDVARIEVPVDRIPELVLNDRREMVAAHLKEMGFLYVTLDMQGFRSGSANEAL